MKSLLRALHGEAAPRPPLWLMRQAGRYLPEYRALRAKAPDFISFCLSPEMAAEVTLQPVRRFGLDAAILFADILLVPHALGQRVRFVEGEGPKLDPIRDEAGLARLSDAQFASTLAPVMQTITRVCAELDANTTLIGFAGAPWTVANYMIEGEGGTDHAEIRRMAWQTPELFDRLMDKLVDATSAYLIAQADAGAEALQLFDSWAGAVPAPLFERGVIAPTRRIVERLRAHAPDVPIIGFPRGTGAHLARYARDTGVQAVGVGQAVDLAAAAQAMPSGVAVQGNLDPVLLLSGGTALERGARDILAAMKGRPFVFNLGHGVLPQTPPEHVARLVEIVRRG